MKPAKGHCPVCGPDRWADIEGEHINDYQIDEADISGTVRHRILKCRGCDEIYFQRYSHEREYHGGPDYDDSEPKLVHWPPPKARPRPSWFANSFDSPIDHDLESLLTEVYSSIDHDLRVVAAIGIRTAFDRASELLDIDPAVTFAEKLSKLESLGKIGDDEKQTLSILTDAASAAAHRGWRPTADEIDVMMEIIEAFIYRSFVLGTKTAQLKSRVPAKPKRQATQKT